MAKLYFSHDVDARNSEELMKVRMQMGPEGYAIYFMLLEKLADGGDHTLEEDYQLLSFDLRSDPEKIRKVAEEFGLFKHEGGRFYSSGLDKRLNAAKDISEKRRQASNSRWMQNRCKTDAIAMQTSASTNQTECTLNINKNKNINNNPPQQHTCVREGFAEEEKENSSFDLFSRFDEAMSLKLHTACVISATDDNRLRRYMTCGAAHRGGMQAAFDSYLMQQKDVTGLRQMLEGMEKQGTLDVIDFDTWKILTSLATLSRADQMKIRQLVREKADGWDRLKDAMAEIEKSNGKIKMPSRYIISTINK